MISNQPEVCCSKANTSGGEVYHLFFTNINQKITDKIGNIQTKVSLPVTPKNSQPKPFQSIGIGRFGPCIIIWSTSPCCLRNIICWSGSYFRWSPWSPRRVHRWLHHEYQHQTDQLVAIVCLSMVSIDEWWFPNWTATPADVCSLATSKWKVLGLSMDGIP